jgi:hypothetical protein
MCRWCAHVAQLEPLRSVGLQECIGANILTSETAFQLLYPAYGSRGIALLLLGAPNCTISDVSLSTETVTNPPEMVGDFALLTVGER